MTDAIDLTKEQRNQLTALLHRFLPGVAVWAYGSRVQWTARPNSDLDLVAFTTPAQRQQVSDLKDALAESNLPFPVDLHVWDDVPERFREIIGKEYVVVQEVSQPDSRSSMAGESSVVHIPSTAVPLPSDWRWERLDEVCDGVFDCPHSTPILTADGPFVVRSQDMRTGVFRMEEAGHVSEDTYQERISRAEPKYGDLFYSREGTYFGIAAEVPTGIRVCLGQRMVLLRPKVSKCNHRFLRYWLNSPVMASHTHGHRDGTVAERLNLPTIRQLPVAIPPLTEQCAIAHILGTLDDKIELNRRMNETLEAMARALFKSWFIDFDPVRRNAARARNQPSPGLRLPSPSGRGAGGEGAKHEGEGSKQYRGGYDFTGLVQTARALRKAQTPAEDLFWELVRDRQLMGLKFRRQHQIGDYIADFYCHEHRMVIEFDGGIHSAKPQKDHKRDAWMEAQGFTVLRFRNEQLLDDPESVLRAIAQVVESHASSPLPLGEGQGEGSVEELDRLFPDSFEDSELGEIPKGWEVKAFADTIEIIGGGTPKTSVAEYWDGDIPWFSVVDAPTASEVWVVDTEKKVTRAGVENSSTRVLPVGTTIISARGTVGRIALVGVSMAMNQSCYGLQGRAGAHGFFNYFSTRELVARLQQHAHGSVFDTITRDTLAGVSVATPAAALIEEFEKRVAPSLQRIRAGLLEARTLAALRDTLLPKLISGELRVKDAERFVERAL